MAGAICTMRLAAKTAAAACGRREAEIADHELRALAGELVCRGVGGACVAAVVHRLQNQRLAVEAAVLVDRGDRLRRAVADFLGERRVGTRKRREDADHDLRLRRGRGEKTGEEQDGAPHRHDGFGSSEGGASSGSSTGATGCIGEASGGRSCRPGRRLGRGEILQRRIDQCMRFGRRSSRAGRG